MLEDIKKIVPELDSSDEEKIYQAIKDKKIEKKPIRFNNRFKLAFSLAILVLIISVPLIIVMVNNINNTSADLGNNANGNVINGNNGNTGNTGEKTKYSSEMLTDKNLIGRAAFIEFDKLETNSLCSHVINLNNEEINNDNSKNLNTSNTNPIQVSYPFSFVKIVNAYKFTINVSDIEGSDVKEVIESSCGLGELEIVIANFETYDGNSAESSCSDLLISIRGHNGYYTILENSYSLRDGIEYFIFSSHKIITSNSIDKDFTPPFVSIIVKKDGDSRYVFFESKKTFGKLDDYNEEYAFKNTSGIENVSKGTLYSVLDLVKVSEKEEEGIITEIVEDYNLVYFETETNLTIIKITDYTEGLKITDLSVGDKVIFTYDYFYEGYNPSIITVNSLKISENNDYI